MNCPARGGLFPKSPLCIDGVKEQPIPRLQGSGNSAMDSEPTSHYIGQENPFSCRDDTLVLSPGTAMRFRHLFALIPCLLVSWYLPLHGAPASSPSFVRTFETTLEIPTYEHSARETEPPLFSNSAVKGLY